MAFTYSNLYMDIRQILINSGAESASLEAREIVCSASRKTREQFYADMTMYASDEVVVNAESMLRRRLAGEHIAYIIGEWEFYGLPLDISRDVLIPRADTEVLAQKAIETVSGIEEGARVLDLCAGSGCVGIAVGANVPSCRVVLADISEAAIRICRQNVRRNELTSRVTCVQADARAPVTSSFGKFDVIVCNPPYIPSRDIGSLDASVRCYEPRLALDGGEDGLDFYRDISAGWRKALRPRGRMLFEVGAGQSDRVCEILIKNRLGIVDTFKDTQSIVRVVTAEDLIL